MNIRYILLLLALFCANANAEQMVLTVSKNGQVIETLTMQAFRSSQKLASLKVDNPTDSRIYTYQGVLLKTFLKQVFGEDWQKFDAVKFVAKDGYAPVIPMASIKAHTGLIAVSEEGRQDFSPLPRSNGETVNPGPFFLVWENIEDAGAKTDDWLSWPWQLVRVELTSLATEYPNSSPPKESDEKVRQGFLAFRQHCMKCHAINGDGGDLAPELNYPVNVTEYRQPQWLARFIENPQSVRADSKMVPFYRDVQNRKMLIEAIIAYLKSMANKKIAVSDE